MEIIDCHSHIGNDWIWGESNIEKYILLAKELGISKSLLMPSPGQVDYKTLKNRLLCYKYEKDKFEYWSQVSKECLSSRFINDKTFDIISTYKDEHNIYFVPFIHPILDTPEYLYELKEKYNPVAFKIHGVASGITPEIFNQDFINALKKINIPIIVHTDYSNDTNSIQYKNSAYLWARFFIENDLKGYLAHAARFDTKAWDLVNRNDNLVIGLGPDLLIYQRKNSFKDGNILPDVGTLKLLHDNLDINKIMFDVDFSWNVVDETKKMDFDMIDRVTREFGEKDSEKVLSLNPKNFFNI